MNASAPSPMWVVSSVPCQVAMPVNRHRHTATTTPHRHHALMHHSLTLICGNRSHPSLQCTSLSLCPSACTRATTSSGYGTAKWAERGSEGYCPGITWADTSSGYGGRPLRSLDPARSWCPHERPPLPCHARCNHAPTCDEQYSPRIVCTDVLVDTGIAPRCRLVGSM